jgi:hypothetical protein
MTPPAVKRFQKHYGKVADAIALLDLDQVEREHVAEAVAAALDGAPDFKRDLFVLLASDPLVRCAGPGDDEPCPHGRVIRIAMHLKDAPDGRSAAWAPRPPTVRCVTCGARERGLVNADT